MTENVDDFFVLLRRMEGLSELMPGARPDAILWRRDELEKLRRQQDEVRPLSEFYGKFWFVNAAIRLPESHTTLSRRKWKGCSNREFPSA